MMSTYFVRVQILETTIIIKVILACRYGRHEIIIEMISPNKYFQTRKCILMTSTILPYYITLV